MIIYKSKRSSLSRGGGGSRLYSAVVGGWPVHRVSFNTRRIHDLNIMVVSLDTMSSIVQSQKYIPSCGACSDQHRTCCICIFSNA